MIGPTWPNRYYLYAGTSDGVTNTGERKITGPTIFDALTAKKVAWKIYGEHSDWKVFFGADAPPRDGADQSVAGIDWRRLDAKHGDQSRALRQALVLQGVDFNGGRALVGTCHTDDVIGETVTAFAAAVRAMKDEGFA